MANETAAGRLDRHALRGVRVVDFSWVLAGPMATKLLGAMGAEVIKIESTQRPEYARRDGVSTIINTSKRSCTINITKPAGQALLRRLVAISDMLVENFSAGVLAKYALGYEEMKAVRPDLIFVSGSGLGRTGPQRHALAYGTLLQAYSGRAGMIGEINPELEGMGIHGWTDPVTATWETLAMLAALYHRRRTGLGAYIDLSMLECTVSLLPEALIRQALRSPVERDQRNGGNREADAVPGGCFACAGEDEWIALSVRTDQEWHNLCLAMERVDLSADLRYSDGDLRIAQREALNSEFAQWAQRGSAESIERRLQAYGVPAARTRNTPDVLNDAHLSARGIFPLLPDGQRTASLPWRDEHGWRGEINPAPELGADNHYVFGELLGLATSEINDLIDAEVIR